MQIRASRISASIAGAITEDRERRGHFPGDAVPSVGREPRQSGQEGGGGNNEEEPSERTALIDKKSGGGKTRGGRYPLISLLASFFSFFRLHLTRYRPDSFLTLRSEAWRIDEDEYLDSFPTTRRKFHHSRPRDQEHQEGEGESNSNPQEEEADDKELLVPAGDLGYSGSTFFTTPNAKFLVKSLPRRFEHSFFTHDLLDPYIAHNRDQPDSLLARITDMPYTARPSLGGILGTAPTHHIVMENLLYGQGQGEWETYDLKPEDYFFPERDIADGYLAPQSVKDRLVDTFPDKVIVPLQQRELLLTTLNHDTQLLASHAAVDYSLFLVRYPQPKDGKPPPPSLHSDVSCPWREGVDDVRGEWTYRAVVLDFFWAKSALQAKAMTGLVDTFNVVADQGPMSITAEPGEYRQRFMKMVDSIVVSESSVQSESPDRLDE